MASPSDKKEAVHLCMESAYMFDFGGIRGSRIWQAFGGAQNFNLHPKVADVMCVFALLEASTASSPGLPFLLLSAALRFTAHFDLVPSGNRWRARNVAIGLDKSHNAS